MINDFLKTSSDHTDVGHKPTLRNSLKRRRQLQNDLEHITQEMYRRNKELTETNKTLSILRTIDSLVLDANSTLQSVCNQTSLAIANMGNYEFVGVLTVDTHLQQYLTMQGCNKGSDGIASFPQPIKIAVDDTWFDRPELNMVVSVTNTNHSNLARLIGYSPAQINVLHQHVGVNSLFVVKLYARRRLVGLIVVGYKKEASDLTDADTRFVSQISETVGLALDNKLLFEENKRVLKQLKISNEKLKALDETKDDFISMASHQLRTPLTSVKGYISLVLEEDAGKLSPLQKKMLEQAFMSSQRMVYLIADLLNVSRLKTGKFIIETRPVNLATLITEEISQLKETVKSHDLTLTFKPPKNFPELALDETKIRQVVMNFADNAIYYTPPGGTVTLELLDNPKSIEFKVTDNGLGVPKSEQPHLFTKFYRAANARKARPDGTGLGLYMAKKVIAAQGGALIFTSKEGKGSTFGFSFSKQHLVEPQHIPLAEPKK